MAATCKGGTPWPGGLQTGCDIPPLWVTNLLIVHGCHMAPRLHKWGRIDMSRTSRHHLLVFALALTVTPGLSGCVRFGFEASGSEHSTWVGGPSGDQHDGGVEGDGHQLASLYLPVVPPENAGTKTVQLIVGVQAKTGSYVRQVTYDPSTPGQEVEGSTIQALRLDTISGSKIRGLSRLGQNVIAGNGFAPAAELASVSPLKSRGKVALSDAGPMKNIHGVCTLPNGHLIVGEFGMGTGNLVAEYAPGGAGFVFLRQVYKTTLSSGSLSHCAARTSTELYITDYAGATDLDGDVVRLVLEGGQWKVSHRFDTSAFNQAKYGPNHQTSIYTFVLHRGDGQLYIFPLRRFGSRVRGLIRCPTPNIDEANCVELGELPPDPSTAVNGPDAIQGAAQLPNSEDIVFSSNRRLYRYEPSSDTWVELFDLWSSFVDLRTKSGTQDIMLQVRGLLAR